MIAVDSSVSKAERGLHPEDLRPSCVKSVQAMGGRDATGMVGYAFCRRVLHLEYPDSRGTNSLLGRRAKRGREYAARHGKSSEEMLDELLDRGAGVK
jgi:hypothetical protein